jgi:periplasmic protein CpxP/Spy
MTAAAALLGACLLVAPFGASAQQSTQPMAPGQAAPSSSAAPAPTAHAPARSKGTQADRVEARIKSLHAQLKITPDEEQQWTVVAQTMRDNAQAIDQLVQQRTAQRGSMNAVEDMKSYQGIAQAHADEMQKLVPAFEALYDKMPDTQKKHADVVFNQRTAARQANAGKKG